jgi:hypothetical protein
MASAAMPTHWLPLPEKMKAIEPPCAAPVSTSAAPRPAQYAASPAWISPSVLPAIARRSLCCSRNRAAPRISAAAAVAACASGNAATPASRSCHASARSRSAASERADISSGGSPCGAGATSSRPRGPYSTPP